MLIKLPHFCLVLLIGPARSGKTHFANQYFTAQEIVTSDPAVINERLVKQQFTIVDAEHLDKLEREALKVIAKKNHCPIFAMLFNTQIEHQAIMVKLHSTLKHEKWAGLTSLNSFEEINETRVERYRLDIDKNDVHGPFDIIGDIHGCYDELRSLLMKLGYQVNDDLLYSQQSAVTAPLDRKVIFVGDLIDRGPNSVGVLALVMNMVKHGVALCIAGNHDIKLASYLKGKKVQISHGLETTAKEFETVDADFKQAVITFIDNLPIYYVLDNHQLIVAHAGMKEFYQGRMSPKIKSFSLFGDTSSEVDEQGYPIRRDWAKDYQGDAIVVYGHTVVAEPKWVNNTLCIDTACVFGGKLTALRYPEKETVSVNASCIYYSD